MEILYKKHKDDKASTIYNMAHGQSRRPLKEFDGDVMEVDNFLIYTDVNADGEVLTFVSIREKDGTTWTTNGATFIREFMAIVEAAESCGEALDSIKIVDGVSKKGRSFRTCEMVE